MNNYLNALDNIVSTLGKEPYRSAGAMMGLPTGVLPKQEVKPTVSKTFVYPDYAAKQTPINPDTGMAMDYIPENTAIQQASSPLLDILRLMSAQSGKPIRNKQIQKTTPYAREDMIANRNKIGEATRMLDEALRGRENFGYSLASALSNIPQQEGYGSWLGDFARSFGAGYATPTNLSVDRALRGYTSQMKDLEDILKFDKEMGGTVETDLGYMYPESNNNDLALAMLLSGK